MPAPGKYSHDGLKEPGQVGGVDRYVIVYVDDDNNLRPLIEKKGNGQHFHMTFKTLTIARNAAYGVSAAQSEDYPEDQIAVFDKQYSAVL